MATLKERLERLMAEMRWDYADLVRESGESRSVVSQWLGRGSKTIHSIGKMEAAERLEVRTGYCALWIAKGAGPERPRNELDPAIVAADMLRDSATLRELARMTAKTRDDLTPEKRSQYLAALERLDQQARDKGH